MAVQLGALRDALLEAGASVEAAGKAAEELAGFDAEVTNIKIQFSGMETRTASSMSALHLDNAEIKGELKLHRWMLGSIFGLLVAICLKLFLH